MPKINLKPRSPEFIESQTSQAERFCDMPGCCNPGEFRAPKDRSLENHYYFCAEHVAEYNQAWDFFDGMNDREIEEHILRSYLWDIQTKKFSDFKEDELLRKARAFYNGHDEDEPQARHTFESDKNTPEFEALAIMGLRPPVDLEVIKKRYKDLAKKHHPDLNRNSPESEELLKSINMAYTILKLAYEDFDALEKETV